MKLKSIQFLRAVAAILVVYQHFVNQPLNNVVSLQQNFYQLKNFGSIGVDLFFIISGFIIMYVANKHIEVLEGIQFLIKRYCRIVPMYYIATLLYLCVLLFLKKWGIYTIYVSSQFEVIRSLSDTILIIPTSGDMYSFSPLLIVGWTLSFEWLFYIFFFVLILMGVKRKLFYIIGLISMLCLLGVIFNFNDLRLIFLTNPIMLEFLLGVTICWFYLKNNTIPFFVGLGCLLLGLASCIVLIIYGFGDIWHYENILSGHLSFKRFLVWGIPSSLIVTGCISLEKNKKLNFIWKNSWLQLAGDASYSIYLFHLIIYYLFLLLFKHINYFLPIDVIIIFQSLFAVICSIVFYKIVERPLLRIIGKSKLWDVITTSNAKTAS